MTYDELYHFGIKGQKWGERRFQNEDGSLTPEGVERYSTNSRAAERALNRLDRKTAKAYGSMMENYGRGAAYIKKGNKDKAAKYGARGDEAVRKQQTYDRGKKAIMSVLKKSGKTVATKDTLRSAGVDVKSTIASTAMATGMALINPLGFGFGYSKSYRPKIVRGTKYYVSD